MLQKTTYYSNKIPVPLTPVLPARIWYMAGYGVTYNANGELTEWQDASNYGLHLYPDGGKATLSPETMNGHPMVRAVGKLATHNLCGITGNMPRTVYFLGRLVEGSVVVSCGTQGDGRLCECMQNNGSVFLHYYGVGMSNLGTLGVQQVYNPALWAWRYNGTGGSFCDFNENRGSQGGPQKIETIDTPFFLGWGAWYSRNKTSTIDFLEVLVYDRFLNAQEDQQVRMYLGTKGNVPFV